MAQHLTTGVNERARVRRPRRITSLAAAATLAFAAVAQGCASGANPELERVVTLEPGRRTRVALQSTSATIAVQNGSSGARDVVYGDAAASPGTKVVDDAPLQQLLDLLAHEGMFRYGRPAQAPLARSVIVVQTPDRAWIWSRPAPTGTNLDEINAFDRARNYVLATFNSETGYAAGSLDSFPPRIRAAMEKTRERAESERAAGDKKDDKKDDPKNNRTGGNQGTNR